MKGALKTMPIKTDWRDAKGIARLLHLGWFRPLHFKSVSAREVRAVLSAPQFCATGVHHSENVTERASAEPRPQGRHHIAWRFEKRIRELAAGIRCSSRRPNPSSARGRRCATSWWTLKALSANSRRRIRSVAVCAMPGIGAGLALIYRSAVDDPRRFTSSKKVGL